MSRWTGHRAAWAAFLLGALLVAVAPWFAPGLFLGGRIALDGGVVLVIAFFLALENA